jgi:hypothetical protein
MLRSEIIVLERGPDEVELDHYIEGIKGSAYHTLCQQKIGGEFIKESLDTCDYLFVHKYGEDIRGFATVKDFNGDDDAKYLYIDLICNSGWGMETRSTSDVSGARAGARAIIDKIIEKGRELHASYIKLNAIDLVISYYWKLGFRFPDVARGARAADLVKELRKAQDPRRGDTDETERLMNDIILRYYPNYLSEKNQQLLATTTGSRIESAQDTGIPMVYIIPPRGGRKYKRSGKKSKGRSKKSKGRSKKSKGRSKKSKGKGRGKKTRKYKSRRI